jgi:hypothetical protein
MRGRSQTTIKKRMLKASDIAKKYNKWKGIGESANIAELNRNFFEIRLINKKLHFLRKV